MLTKTSINQKASTELSKDDIKDSLKNWNDFDNFFEKADLKNEDDRNKIRDLADFACRKNVLCKFVYKTNEEDGSTDKKEGCTKCPFFDLCSEGVQKLILIFIGNLDAEDLEEQRKVILDLLSDRNKIVNDWLNQTF